MHEPDAGAETAVLMDRAARAMLQNKTDRG